MRKLELHVNDMDFLINELVSVESKYESLILMYGGRRLRKIKDPVQREQDKAMVEHFRQNLRKTRKIMQAMRDQGVYYR